MIIDIKGYKVQIDEEDADRVTARSWWVSSAPEVDGHVLCFSARIGKKIIKMHRFIMGNPENYIVDHINGDRLNNKKANLRVCSLTENNRNVGRSRRNTSGYKGVSFDKRRGKWRAYIHYAGHQKHLGMFETPQEADKAYRRAMVLFFGDYCRRDSV
jgi:hypothetical protein